MNLVVVGLLIGLWAWVLLPGLLRERRNSSPMDSVNSFERSMETLAQTGDADVAAPSGREILVLADPERIVTGDARSPAELRRRALLWRGGSVTALAAVVGIVVGGWWWTPLVVLGPLYAVYVALAVRLERRLAEQREMLHDLDEERRRRAPVTPIRRDDVGVEVAVGDESGIIVTGWNDDR